MPYERRKTRSHFPNSVLLMVAFAVLFCSCREYRVERPPPQRHPVLVHPDPWSLSWGGRDTRSAGDYGFAIAVDSRGNAYVAGSIRERVDFDPSTGFETRDGRGTYLCKFTQSGELDWVKFWPVVSPDGEYHLIVDRNDDIYLAAGFYDIYIASGVYESPDLDPGPGIEERASNGGVDIFLCKFDLAGNMEWVRTWGGSSGNGVGLGDYVRGISVSDFGDIAVLGDFDDSVDFDPGPGSAILSAKERRDIFVSLFNSDGDFQMVKTFESTDWSFATDVIVDSDGSIYVTGVFQGDIDLDPGPGICIQSQAPFEGAVGFLSKLDQRGQFQWGELFAPAWTLCLAADETGNICVGGFTYDSPGFAFDSALDPYAGSAFLAMYSACGNHMWTQYWGSVGDPVREFSTHQDDQGNFVTAGGSHSAGKIDTSSYEPQRGFLRMSSRDGELLREYTFESPSSNGICDLALYPFGFVYLTGYYTDSLELDPSFGVEDLVAVDGQDAFLLRLRFDESE